MLILHNSNRKNYAIEAVLLLHQLQYILSPQEAEQLLFNRFLNTNGLPGRNISSDLHMEQLNRLIKNGINDLG
jgi:hypothetical protein